MFRCFSICQDTSRNHTPTRATQLTQKTRNISTRKKKQSVKHSTRQRKHSVKCSTHKLSTYTQMSHCDYDQLTPYVPLLNRDDHLRGGAVHPGNAGQCWASWRVCRGRPDHSPSAGRRAPGLIYSRSRPPRRGIADYVQAERPALPGPPWQNGRVAGRWSQISLEARAEEERR